MYNEIFSSVGLRGITSEKFEFNKENIDEVGDLLKGVLKTIERYRLFDRCELHISGNTLNLKSANIQEWINNIGEESFWLNTCKNSKVSRGDMYVNYMVFNVNFDVKFQFEYKESFEIIIDLDYGDDSIYVYFKSDL